MSSLNTSLPFGRWKERSQALSKPKAGVTYRNLNTTQSALCQMPQETGPSFLVLFHAFFDAQHLTIPLMIHTSTYGNQHRHVADFACLAAFEEKAPFLSLGIFSVIRRWAIVHRFSSLNH